MNTEQYLKETKILNFSDKVIQELIDKRGWRTLNEFEKIQSIYNFVRDEIKFGYNSSDTVTAARVIKDGYGQCNTKGTLFMALLRGVQIPCRLHAFMINKKLQKGAVTGYAYRRAPEHILHSWVEVYYEEQWFELEGFILDKAYLTKLQNKFNEISGSFCGYGAAVKDLQHPVIDWNANNTYIQKEGIVKDLGLYNTPDELALSHHQSISWIQNTLYQYIVRHKMNYNVKQIRQ